MSFPYVKSKSFKYYANVISFGGDELGVQYLSVKHAYFL